MLIPFLCLCPLRLAIMLNFYTLKVAYWITEHHSAEQEVAGSNPYRTNTQGLKIITEENVLPLL